jgi:hypothetical protein
VKNRWNPTVIPRAVKRYRTRKRPNATQPNPQRKNGEATNAANGTTAVRVANRAGSERGFGRRACGVCPTSVQGEELVKWCP